MRNLPKSHAGMSLLEVILAVAIGGLVMMGGLKALNASFSGGKQLSALALQQGAAKVLAKEMRTDYLYRTQLDTVLGSGFYDGVSYDANSDPTRIELRTRSRQNENVLSMTQYGTECRERLASVPLPALPSDFCSHTIPSCSGRLNIFSRRYPDANRARSRTRHFPAIDSKSPIVASLMCIVAANNDRLSLKLAFARRNDVSKTIAWSIEDLEIWDDTGMNTIEFLK